MRSNDVLDGWPASNAIDAKTNTAYSSKPFATDQNDRDTHLAAWVGDGPVSVSQLVLTARMNNGVALGFPKTYSIYLTDATNSKWVSVGQFTQQPDANGTAAINLGQSYSTWGALISPTVLGVDDHGNHYFQLAEVSL